MFEALIGRPVAAVRPSRPARVGVPGGYLLARLDPEVRLALASTRANLVRAGHHLEDVEIPSASITPDVYLHIVLPEASQYHAPMLATDADRYSPGVRLRLEMGRYVLAEDYVRAMALRRRLMAQVDAPLDGYDALLLPALAIPAQPLGATTVDIEGTPEPVRAAMLRLTQLFNLTGHPAIAIPAGTATGGLPIGKQLVGRRGATSELLALAEALEAQIAGGSGSVGGGTG
jgi:aspartyl-tRNA(Asn)/glutamyl-tRNA(Gln) amidotransferase subunit A